jgi:hypothetical protein
VGFKTILNFEGSDERINAVHLSRP